MSIGTKMADKRMFSKLIVDSDAFLDMPLSTQALYFHLSMRADDEGFINNPKKIMRMIGASQNELAILISKRFVLVFDSGVIVIKHWRLHNIIRQDRLKETVHLEERSGLKLNKNESYTEIGNNKTGKPIEHPKKEMSVSAKNRNDEIKNSELPYSFSEKIKKHFDKEYCPVCNIQMIYKSNNRSFIPTIQHCKPLSKGGKHEINNIAVICHKCNATINNNETGLLNNSLVIETWNTISGQSAVNQSPRLEQISIDKISNNTYSLPSGYIEDIGAVVEDFVEKFKEYFKRPIPEEDKPAIKHSIYKHKKAIEAEYITIEIFLKTVFKRILDLASDAKKTGKPIDFPSNYFFKGCFGPDKYLWRQTRQEENMGGYHKPLMKEFEQKHSPVAGIKL